MDDTEKRADPAVASMTEEADLDAPACGNVSADISAFDDDEDMSPYSSSENSNPKRGRNSPAKGPVGGTKFDYCSESPARRKLASGRASITSFSEIVKNGEYPTEHEATVVSYVVAHANPADEVVLTWAGSVLERTKSNYKCLNEHWTRPETWKTSEQHLPATLKGWLRDGATQDKKVKPLLQALLPIASVTDWQLYDYCVRLCAGKSDKKYMHVPVVDAKTKPSRLTHMIPAVARFLKLNFNGLLNEIQRNADDMTFHEMTSSKKMSLGEMQLQVQQLKQELEDAETQLEEQVIENEELHGELDEMGHQLEVERRAFEKKSERQKSERARLAKWNRKRGKKQRRQALADMKSKVEELESRALAAEKRLKKSEAGRRKSEAAAAEAAEKLRKVKGKVKALSETVAAQENTIEELIENYKEALREDTDQHEHERAQQQQKHHHHDVAHSGTWLVQGEAESRLPHCSAWGFKMRKTIIQLLAIGTAPSKVAATISITRTGAGLEPIRFPNKRFMQAMRSELRGVVELLAVYLCANEDWEWLSSSFDGSNKGSLDLVTFNVKVRNKQTNKTRMVCLRGAMVPENKTAVGELNAIKQQVFVSLRKRLELWIKIHRQMFPGKAHSIPDPASFSLARLAKSAVKSDGCNQALKMCRLVKGAIIEKYIESLDGGQAEWDGLEDAEKEEATRVYIVTCQNHLRATAVRRGIKHEKAFLKAELAQSLSKLDSDLRATYDCTVIVRASAKEFVYFRKKAYAKGKGATFLSYVIIHHPIALVWTLIRVDLGVRLDSELESAVALYMNRKIFMEFLCYRIDAADKDNTLENHLWLCLSSSEVIAALRCRCMLWITVIIPLRFFTNDSDVDFSAADMHQVLEPLYGFLQELERDGKLLMNINLDIYSKVGLNADGSDGTASLAYKAWLSKRARKQMKTIDGESSLPFNRLTDLEVFEPKDADNQATDSMVESLNQVWATGLLEGLEKSPLQDYVESGPFSLSGVNDVMRGVLRDTNATNDESERSFANYDDVQAAAGGKMLPGEAGAQAAERQNRSIVQVPLTAHRTGGGARDRDADSGALIDWISEEEQMSLIETARQDVPRVRAEDDEHKLKYLKGLVDAQEESRKKKLELAAKRWARASEFYDMERITTAADLTEALAGKTESKKLVILKEQITIRVVGYGWTQFKTPWSVAGVPVSVASLTAKANAMFIAEESLTKPDEAPVPEAATARLGSIGTLSTQALELASESKFSIAELKDVATGIREAKKSEREAKAGAMHDIHAVKQPPSAPELSIGLKIEVLGQYEMAAEDEGAKSTWGKHWFACEVIGQSSGDGTHKKADKGGSLRTVAKGWTLVKYEDDGEEEWLRLKDFNCMNISSWRLDLDYADLDLA